MLEKINKHLRSSKESYKYSILLPSWNNLEYLKLCVRSIHTHSYYNPQIIVIVNEGKDGTVEWIDAKKEIDYIHVTENIGICYGLNSCRSLIKSDYVVYINDDMYVLPGWDKVLFDEVAQIDTREFILSSTMIEPTDTGNRCVVVQDFGQAINSFKEDALLKEYVDLYRNDWCGGTWPPNLVHIDVWDLVGGLSIEFSPGMYSDPDFSRKLYELGVRIFKGKGNSLVYHFGSKSTRRIKTNQGRKTFILKWGISSKSFTQNCLRMGSDCASGSRPTASTIKTKGLINLLKRIKSCF